MSLHAGAVLLVLRGRVSHPLQGVDRYILGSSFLIGYLEECVLLSRYLKTLFRRDNASRHIAEERTSRDHFKALGPCPIRHTRLVEWSSGILICPLLFLMYICIVKGLVIFLLESTVEALWSDRIS